MSEIYFCTIFGERQRQVNFPTRPLLERERATLQGREGGRLISRISTSCFTNLDTIGWSQGGPREDTRLENAKLTSSHRRGGAAEEKTPSRTNSRGAIEGTSKGERVLRTREAREAEGAQLKNFHHINIVLYYDANNYVNCLVIIF